MAAALDAYAPESGAASGYRRFQAAAERLHHVSERYFFWRSVGSVRDTFDAGTTFRLSVLSDLLALRFGRTVAGTVRGCVREPRVAQMLDHFTQYVGSAPDASPAVLCGIAHMQTDEGVWYPMGGTRAVPIALAKLARELGVEIRTNTHISRILNQGGQVTGVRTNHGEEIVLRAIVSNCDSVRTHRELIGGEVGAQFELPDVIMQPADSAPAQSSGPGVPPGEEERIFDKFQRLDMHRTVSGAGIGLSICKGIVEAHGGTIRVEPREGGGASFRFTLPLAQNHQETG
jgi:phytoene dehydrogenase-like protein